MGAPLHVGVFGGSFDPPHVGHAAVAAGVAAAAGLDRVLWVPAANPPHKPNRTLAAPEARARMVRAAIRDDPRFELCTLELERGSTSFTADTLRALRAAHPDWRLSLILGADQMAGFATWREPCAVAALAQLVVAPRCGRHGAGSGTTQFAPRLVETIRTDLSSTNIRDRARRGLSLSPMVTSSVMALIQSETLYRRRPTSRGPGGRSQEAALRPARGGAEKTR